jgi:formylglycine-generating enzyme required for sulfatase activity
MRGGSCDVTPLYCRSAYRHRGSPDYRYVDVGFRVAVDFK